MLISIIEAIGDKDKYLVKMISSVEKMIFIDSYTVILKARAISERIIRNIFVSEGIVETSDMNQKERIILLQEQGIFSEEIAKMFHTLRFFGNRAIHDELEGAFETSLMVYRLLFRVLCWYVVVYVKDDFVCGDYVEPGVIGRINEAEGKLSEAVNLVMGKAYV